MAITDGGMEMTDNRSNRMRRDVMAKLEATGRLKSDHLLAVEDIRRIWRAFSRGLFPAARDISRPKVDGCRSFIDPIGRMREGEAALYARRYKPWADWASKQLIANGAAERVTLLQLTYDMVIDNMGPRQWEDRYRVRHGTATGMLARALETYLAGPGMRIWAVICHQGEGLRALPFICRIGFLHMEPGD